MNVLVSIMIGILISGAIYCILRRSITRIIIGILLLSQAVNLIVFSAPGIGPNPAPIIEPGQKVLPEGTADPLPQALVLTAIVIGFGLVAFTLALFQQCHTLLGEDDVNEFNRTDQ